MRAIIYGLGAIGGVMAVEMAKAGKEIIAIARGEQLEKVRKDGMKLRAPDGEFHERFPVVSHPREITFRDDDIIFMTMKTQHTEGALHDLRHCGLINQTIACVQNGVANERIASRYFDNVVALMVDVPAMFITPGEVVSHYAPRRGTFRIGKYPSGIDARARQVAELLDGSNFGGFVHPNAMNAKYGKLMINVANGIDPVLGREGRNSKYMKMAVDELKSVYQAAGIEYDDPNASQPDREAVVQFGKVPGHEGVGSSAIQSVMRGTGNIEVDYLNGEIALLGRLHGVPTPVNAMFTFLANKLVSEGKRVGSMSEDEVDAYFEKWKQNST